MLSNETVKSLLVSGFLCMRHQNEDGNTLLHISLFQDNPTLTKTLIDHVIKTGDTVAINLANEDGDTPLHVAARLYPQERVILDLVDAGAKLGVCNNNDEVVDFPVKSSQGKSNNRTTTKNNINVLVINSGNENDSPKRSTLRRALDKDDDNDEEIVRRIDRAFDRSSDEYPSHLSIESMSDFKPRNDLLMPF